jgi:hypothetical protein
MIGFFPDPYPEELLYSACARYAQRVNYPNKQKVITDLFGKKGLSAIVDFPTRLELFVSAIMSHKYSADEIINQNTLYPFYEPFVTIERAKIIRREMKSLTENHLQSRLAGNINQIKLPTFLRFCPLCVEEDRKELGETYWHRIHQLAGILVCPKHDCFLQNSSLAWGRKSSNFFHSAEDFVKPKDPKFINNEKSEHQIYLFLAENAQWLLNQENLSLKSGELRERYYNLLLERGYAYYNGRVKNTKLYKEFTESLPQELLEKLGCQIKSAGRNWLSRMTEKVLADVLYHPIRHLLLLKFLKLDAKELFSSFVEFKPFGKPPYPCLNKISQHHGKLRIKSCQVFDNLTKGEKFRRPIAIFSCDCGFIYQRLGPDKSDEDKFRYDSVRQYGDLWEKELANHWAKLNLSLSEIARRFGTTTLLIARHAIRLDLPRNSEGTRSLQGYERYLNPRKYFSENLEKNRNSFLEVLKKYPKADRTLLIKKASFVLLWLYRNDEKWLEAHLPEQTRVFRKTERFDWKKIDKELSKQTKKTYSEIRKSPGKPIRVSITEIIRRTGQKAWIEKREKKLPLTAKVINKSLESLEDFMMRKLIWAENKFIEEKIIPTKNQLIRRAVIENTTTQNSRRIQNEIEMSLDRIRVQIK